jgi:hypothetical protein
LKEIENKKKRKKKEGQEESIKWDGFFFVCVKTVGRGEKVVAPYLPTRAVTLPACRVSVRLLSTRRSGREGYAKETWSNSTFPSVMSPAVPSRTWRKKKGRKKKRKKKKKEQEKKNTPFVVRLLKHNPPNLR